MQSSSSYFQRRIQIVSVLGVPVSVGAFYSTFRNIASFGLGYLPPGGLPRPHQTPSLLFGLPTTHALTPRVVVTLTPPPPPFFLFHPISPVGLSVERRAVVWREGGRKEAEKGGLMLLSPMHSTLQQPFRPVAIFSPSPPPNAKKIFWKRQEDSSSSKANFLKVEYLSGFANSN